MQNDPIYNEIRKKIYNRFQHYRRIKEILSKLSDHQYPEQEPFTTLTDLLCQALRKENISEIRRIAQNIHNEWLKWRYTKK